MTQSAIGGTDAHDLDDSGMTARELLGILFSRWRTMLAVFIGVVGITAFLVFYFISPAYQAAATIVISGNNLSTPLLEALPITDFEKITAFQTQKDVLQSTSLAARVVDKLDLIHRMQLSRYQRLRLTLREWKRQVGKSLGIESWSKPENMRALAIKILLDRMQITTKPESQAIKIAYQAGDPKEATETLSALIDEFGDYYNRRIHERAEGAAALLQEQLGDMQDSLRQSEEAMVKFRKSDSLQLDLLRPVPQNRGNPHARGASDALSNSQRVPTDSRSVPGPTTRTAAASSAPAAPDHRSAVGGGPGAGNMVVGSEAPVRMAPVAQLPSDRANSSNGPAPSRMSSSSEMSITGLTDSQSVQNELKVAILSMEEELRKMRIEYPDTRPEVVELRARIANYVAALNQLPERELELLRLKRELDMRQDALLTLQRSYEKARFVARGTIAKADLISVLERPVAADDAVSPKPRLTMALAVVFGGLFGMIWAICLHYIDPRLTGPRDVRRYLRTRVIGSMAAV
jgi:uncharacterized protein involved in exopolysaccharide biosynthesis